MARLVEKLEKISPAKVSEIAAKYLTDQNRTVCRCIGRKNNHGLETDLAKLVEEQPAGPGVKCLLYRNANNPTVAVHGSILARNLVGSRPGSQVYRLPRLLIEGKRKPRWRSRSRTLLGVL